MKECRKNAQGSKNRIQLDFEEIRQQSVNNQGRGAGSDFPCRPSSVLFSLPIVLPYFTPLPVPFPPSSQGLSPIQY